MSLHKEKLAHSGDGRGRDGQFYNGRPISKPFDQIMSPPPSHAEIISNPFSSYFVYESKRVLKYLRGVYRNIMPIPATALLVCDG